MKLPTLYKKTSTGKIQQWDIQVIPNPALPGVYDIETRFGQVGGKIQETSDSIFEGKNIGKVNETTVQQQAESEAQSKWQKQVDKGYVQNPDDAEAGKSSVVVKAMLAHAYHKHGAKKMQFPCLTQPKLDGVRCLAVVQNGVCNLYTRTGKPITAVPHVAEAVASLFQGDCVIDGELYNHDLKEDFEKIVSLVRKKDPVSEGAELIQYHVYDMVSDQPFPSRIELLGSALQGEHPVVKFVDATKVESEEEAFGLYENHLIDGYEGIMFRSMNGGYEGKRSYNLLKYKGEMHDNVTSYSDEEFEIVGVHEGRGKLRGHAAAFICKTEEGKEFKAKMEGSLDNLKMYFNDHSLWTGKKLTVKYQGRTNKENVPRFPIGKAIRDYE